MSDKNLNILVIVGFSALFIALAILRPDSLAKVDIRFIGIAAKANLEEACLDQMAEHKASLPITKTFGQQLSNDDATAYKELGALASGTGHKIPTALGDDKKLDRLAKLDGAQFDVAFLDEEVQVHKSVIAAFKSEAEHGDNTEVVAWAENKIPTLERHLDRAERLVIEEKSNK